MPRVKLFNEQDVLEKAMFLFWKKGYCATSVQDLVNQLGINRASLYDTFGGKKELYNKAFLLYRKIMIKRVGQFLSSQNDVKEGLKKLFMFMMEMSIADVDNKGCFIVNTTAEFAPKDAEVIQSLEDVKARFVQVFYNYLLLGEQKKQIPKGKNLHAIAALLYTFYNGLQVVTKLDFNKKQFSESLNALLSILD